MWLQKIVDRQDSAGAKNVPQNHSTSTSPPPRHCTGIAQSSSQMLQKLLISLFQPWFNEILTLILVQHIFEKQEAEKWKRVKCKRKQNSILSSRQLCTAWTWNISKVTVTWAKREQYLVSEYIQRVHLNHKYHVWWLKLVSVG